MSVSFESNLLFFILTLTLYYATNIFLFKNARIALLISLFSFSLSYTIFTLARFALSFLLYALSIYIKINFALLLLILSGLLTLFLSAKILSIKRSKSSMPFLLSLSTANTGFIISLCILLLCVAVHYIPTDKFYLSTFIQLLACY